MNMLQEVIVAGGLVIGVSGLVAVVVGVLGAVASLLRTTER